MSSRRGLAVLGAVVVSAVVIGSSLSGASGHARPQVFVSVLESGTSLSSRMALFSSRTGALAKKLGSFSDKYWTNNGLAFAPDGSAVYFTLIPRRPHRAFYLRLMRLDVANRRQTQIARGAQPAVSANGTQLAYAAVPHGLAVRDLATGATRTIGLAAQLGKQADLLNAAIGWFGNNSELAIIPSPPVWDLVGRAPPPAPWCGTTTAHAVIVFVHVPPAPHPLSAKCAHVNDSGLLPPPVVAPAPDPGSSTSVLVAAGNGKNTRIERISQAGTTTRLATIRDSLPVAFDSTGTHVMYLVGHNPPRLWEATLANGQLTDRRPLPKRPWGAIAW